MSASRGGTVRTATYARIPVKAALALTLMVVLLPASMVARLAPRANAAEPDPGSITLHVQAARSVGSAAGLVHKGDTVDSYKWIINRDDTGDPGTAAHPLTDQCLPSTAAGGSSNPDFADSCPWPSTRNTSGFAPIVAQGDQSDLDDSVALDGLPVGKYLISVTADGLDRKSTRLNSSHVEISYAVFCLKKKKKHANIIK